MKRSKCTFVPTCSNYAVESLREYGALKGSVLGAWRVLRCNPFNKAYHDPPTNWGDKLHFKQTQKLNGKING